MIDGHRGDHIAKFIKNHLLNVVYRNENIMVHKHYQKGLKQVFLKLDELIQSKPGMKEIREYLGEPEIYKYRFCKPHSNPVIAE